MRSTHKVMALAALAVSCGPAAERAPSTAAPPIARGRRNAAPSADSVAFPGRLQQVWSEAMPDPPNAGAISPDGRRVAVQWEAGTGVWDAATGNLVAHRVGFPSTLGFFRFRDHDSLVGGFPHPQSTCALNEGPEGPCLQLWRPASDSTTSFELPLGGVDLSRCRDTSALWSGRGATALACDRRSRAEYEAPGDRVGRLAVFTWDPPGVRMREIAVTDIDPWPTPAPARRAVEVEQAVVSETGHVAVLVDLLNEQSRSWEIVATGLVILDPNLQITSARPIAPTTQRGSTLIAWTLDGSLMLLDESIFGVGIDPREWIALRVSTSGEIEAQIPRPDYPNGIAQAYLAQSNRIVVVARQEIAVLDGRTGEVLHRARSPEQRTPPRLFVSEDERYVLLLGFESASVWALPTE